jgi:hypothetical protein
MTRAAVNGSQCTPESDPSLRSDAESSSEKSSESTSEFVPDDLPGSNCCSRERESNNSVRLCRK